jgi:N-acetylglutamate synthase-like GNAT family acetyltransferase
MVIEIEFGTPLYDSSVQLRDLILRKPLNLEFTAEQLAAEYDSFHFAYMDEQFEMLGCLVMKPVDKDTVKMRQVAVLDEYQNKGIGTSLVFYVEKWARERGFTRIILHARDAAIPFYDRLNYSKKGKPFTEVGIQHIYMEKEL